MAFLLDVIYQSICWMHIPITAVATSSPAGKLVMEIAAGFS
jgi:hypothetical protein